MLHWLVAWRDKDGFLTTNSSKAATHQWEIAWKDDEGRLYSNAYISKYIGIGYLQVDKDFCNVC